MRNSRFLAILIMVLGVVGLTFGCTNPKDEFRTVGTAFAENIAVNKDVGATAEQRAPNAFGNDDSEIQALIQSIESTCGAVQGMTEESLETGPSVEAEATGTMIFNLESENECQLRISMILKDDKAMVQRARIITPE
jgi:hypothetical protein